MWGKDRARMIAIMTRDEHKPVGYWLLKDGARTWVETRPASASYTDIEREKARNRRCRECAMRLDVHKVQKYDTYWVVELVCWRCGISTTEQVPYASGA
jgi:hypothetical protein